MHFLATRQINMFFYNDLDNIIKFNTDGTFSIVKNDELNEGVTNPSQLPKTELMTPMSDKNTPKQNNWRDSGGVIPTDMPDFNDLFGR